MEQNSLAHVGVMGMKWGVHKTGSSTSAKKVINPPISKGQSVSRKAKKEDLGEITNLLDSLPSKDKQFLALSQKLPLIKQIIKSEKHCTVSTIDGKIVGFARESGRPKGFVLLEELVVDPQYRGKGVASKMLNEFNAANPKTLAKTNAQNDGMISLLKKTGYTVATPETAELSKGSLGTSAQKRIINWSRDTTSKGGTTMEQNSLAHVGIMGMKWGHRSGSSSSGGGRTGSRGGSAKTNNAKEAVAKAAARKEKIADKAGKLYRHRKEFTPAEMAAAVKNLNLKAQIKDLKTKDINQGADKARAVLKVVGTVVAAVAVAKTVVKTVKGLKLDVAAAKAAKAAATAAKVVSGG